MVNKKAWLRIIEATLCTLIILGVVLTLYYGSEDKLQHLDNQEVKIILNELSKNDSLRYNIISVDLSNKNLIEKEVNLFVLERIKNKEINITSRICDPNEIMATCSLGFSLGTQREIFAESLILSTFQNATNYNLNTPKKVKIYYWES